MFYQLLFSPKASFKLFYTLITAKPLYAGNRLVCCRGESDPVKSIEHTSIEIDNLPADAL